MRTLLICLSLLACSLWGQNIKLDAPGKQVRGVLSVINGGTGTTTGIGVITAHVKDYGAIGNGVVDDTTAFQTAINAVQGTNKTLLCNEGKYKTTSSLIVTSAPFSLEGRGSCTIAPVASSGTIYGLQLNFQSYSSATTVAVGVNTTSRATQSTNQITVSSAAGYSIGDYVVLIGTQNGNTFGQLTRIRNIVGAVFTLWDAVGIPIQLADANSVQKTPLGSDLSVRGVTFDGLGVTGTAAAYGLYVSGATNSIFESISTKNFSVPAGGNVGGFNCSFCYHVIVSKISSFNDGTVGVGAVYLPGIHSSAVSDISVSSPVGFGIFISGAFNDISNLTSTGGGTNGRGIKLYGLGWSNLSNLHASSAAAGYTGIDLDGGSWRNNIFGVVTNSNSASGVLFAGGDEIYNVLEGVLAIGNGVGSDVLISPTSNFNSILGLSRNSTITNSGTSTVISLEGQGGGSLSIGCSGVTTANATNYINFNPPAACNALGNGIVQTSYLMSSTKLVWSLYVQAQAAGVNASSGVFTVLKNGVATSITCTVGTGTTCSDLDPAHATVFAANDRIAIRFTTQIGETLADLLMAVNY